MRPLVLFICLVILLDCIKETEGGCSDGKSRCDWLNWHEWGSCSRTCGVGRRYRRRGMCCKHSLADDWDACLSDCGHIEKDAHQTSLCNEICFNSGRIVSDSSTYYGRRCHCTYLYTGSCCDQRTCSWDNYYCWPGNCYSSRATSCNCARGFHKKTGSSETTCQLDQSNAPTIETCETRVMGPNGELKRAASTSSSTACAYLTDFYGNFQPKYLIYDMLTEFKVDIGSYTVPEYIHEYHFGVTDTFVSVSVHPITGSELQVSTRNIFAGRADSSNVNRTSSEKFNLTLAANAQRLIDGQWLCTAYHAKGGGFLRSVDVTQDHRTPSSPVPYSKTQTSRRICYRYDSSKPEHCKLKHTCNYEPLQISEIITSSEVIHTNFQGWMDPIPNNGNASHASGIESYRITVNEVLASKGDLKIDTGIVYTTSVSSSKSPISLNLTSDKPKLYAIYIEVKDVADNVRQARRFVLFDKSSTIEVLKSKSFYVESASGSTNYTWQTHHHDICLNWTDYFYNKFYLENPLLNRIEPDPTGLITNDYEQKTGLLPVSGTPNIHGIVSFMMSWSRNHGSFSSEIKVPNFKQQQVCQSFRLYDGETYILNINAIDIANHTLSANRTVHIDRSVPHINNIWLVNDETSRLFVHDMTDLSQMNLYFEALDPHSGIREIEWAFGISDSGTELTTGNIGVNTLNEERCPSNTSAGNRCYCPDVGSCEMFAYTLPMNKLMVIDKHRGDHNRNYYFTIKVTNHALLSNIEHLEILVDDSPPETGVILEGSDETSDIDYTSDTNFIVHWHGFIDHESGIREYIVVLADHCLSKDEMANTSYLETLVSVKVPQSEYSVMLTANFTGKKYTSILAINNAMDSAEPVCSDGITRDTSPPQVTNVTLQNGKRTESVTCHNGRAWLMLSEMQKIQLHDTPTCFQRCSNLTTPNEDAEIVPTLVRETVDNDVSEYMCKNHRRFSIDNNIIYIPSDHIDLNWNVEEVGSQIHDYFIGIGYDSSESLRPGQMDYVSTHKRERFKQQHVGIGSSQLFYIFLKAVNKAGLSKISTIGPVMIDETPPLSRHAPDVRTSEQNIVLSWENDTFYDLEQTEQIDRIFFQFGHDEQMVTPLMEWKLDTSPPCIGHSGGCIVYPLERLQRQDTDTGLHFYVSLNIYNKAGHFLKLQTETFNIPSKYPPGKAVVLDIDPIHKDLCSDIEVHFTKNVLCAKWSGFRHHENITTEVGVGETAYTDDVISFRKIEHSSFYCINSSKLLPVVRYHFLLRSTCSGGHTLSASNGVSILTQSQYDSLVAVHIGKNCKAMPSLANSHIQLNESKLAFKPNFSLEIGKMYKMFVPTNVTIALQNDEGLAKKEQDQHYGRYYSIVPFVEYLKITVMITDNTFGVNTLTLIRCASTNFLQNQDNVVDLFWEWSAKMFNHVDFEATVIDRRANSSGSTDVNFYQSLVQDKGMAAQLRATNVRPGGLYSIALRPCAQEQCLQPIYTKNFTFVFSKPCGYILSAEIKREPAKGCFDISIEWNKFNSESPVVFYQWSINDDGYSLQPLTTWVTISKTDMSKYQVSTCLYLPVDLHKALFFCVRVFTEAEQSATVCKELSVKSLDAYSTNVVYDIDTTKKSWLAIKQIIASSNLGNMYRLLHESELDFGGPTSQLAGLIVYGTERTTHWFMMTKQNIPLNCKIENGCIKSVISNTGFIEFKNPGLQENMLYYICAFSNVTHVIRETFTEVLPEIRSCSDGFFLDNTSPFGGTIYLPSNGKYLSDISNIRITWDGFRDNIDASKLGYIDNIKSYSAAVGSRPGGEDLKSYLKTGLSKSTVVNLTGIMDGSVAYISVKATDHAGLSTTVTSSEFIIDTSPPKSGKILLNQNYDILYVASQSLHIHVFGFDDIESGIDKYVVMVGTRSYVDDVYPATEFTDENHILQILKDTIHDGHKYFLTLKAVNRAGLSSGPSVRSFIFDKSEPTGGHVIDGDPNLQRDVDYQRDIHHIKVHWKGFDDIHSGIKFYRVGLGLKPYEDDVQSMLDVGLNTDISWNASYIPGQRYYTLVEACNSAGLCSMRSSDGIVLDNSPPIHGLVRVGSANKMHQKYIPKRSSVHLNWYGFEDPQSDIERFEACIGSKPAICDIVSMFDCLLQSSVLKTGVNLPRNQNLYATVRAYNKVRMSVLQSSDAFSIDDTQPIIISKPVFVLDHSSVPSFSVQWEPSLLKVFWKFEDGDSPITSHILTLKTYHEGHTPVENIHLGSETSISISLDGNNWLNNGDKYFVVVTGCNAAGLCTFSESSDLLIDHSPPHLGGFRPPMTWITSPDELGNDYSNISLTWYGFHDQESGIEKYFITVGRSYSGYELSGGEITVLGNSTSDIQETVIRLHHAIKRDDLLILSVWAQNNAGLNSSIARVSVNALSTSYTSSTLQDGILELEKHSCDIHYCNKDCTCAVIGKPCIAVNSSSVCTILDAKEVVARGLPSVYVFGGLEMFPVSTTSSSACLSGHWILSNQSSHISRFEWSIGIINQPIGEGIFDLKKEIPWRDQGQRKEVVHCLSANQSLIHAEQYVFYVRVWYTSDLSAIFQSHPISIDQTPPSVRRGRFIKDSDVTCVKDFDFIDWMDTITACWDNVFSEENSKITYYVVALGTSPAADDVLPSRNVSLSTNITVTNLTLSHGTRYYFSVTVYNTIGLHTTLTSDGFVIDMDIPIDGVVFNTDRHINSPYQSDNTSFTLSWHGFIDHYSGILKYYVALVEESEFNVRGPTFVDVGLQNMHMFDNVRLVHGKRYFGIVKAVDAAGHESKLSASPLASIDTTPPQIVGCSIYDDIFEETTYCSTDNAFEISHHEDLIENMLYKVHGLVIADDTMPLAELNINRFSVILPLTIHYEGHGNFQYEFLHYSSGKSNIKIQGQCLANTTVLVTISKCIDIGQNIDSGISLQQIGTSKLLTKFNTLDNESGIRKIYTGLGTTRGGYQIKPLLSVHDGAQRVEIVDVPQGTQIFATVMAYNAAGLLSVFHSKPVVMDKTAPLFRGSPDIMITRDDNATYSFKATWKVDDDESGIKQCYCSLENQYEIKNETKLSLAEDKTWCKKENVSLEHGDRVHMKVVCINMIELDAVSFSRPLDISKEPPSVNDAKVVIVPTGAEKTVTLQTPDHLAVQSNNTCVQIQWTGFSDVFGIDNFEYRLKDGNESITGWTDAGRKTTSTIKGLHLQFDTVYTAEVRAWNTGQHASDVLMADVLILGSGPSLTGTPMHMEKSNQQMDMDWSMVFNIHKRVPVRYTLIMGSKNGYNDVIELTTTSTTYTIHVPDTTLVTTQVGELFVHLTCSYVTGLSSAYETTFKLNYK